MKPIGLTVGVVIILITLFMWVNAPALFGSMAEQAKNVMGLYLVMLAVILAAFQIKMPTLNYDITSLIYFVIGFGVTVFVMLIIPVNFKAMLASFELITAVSLGFLYAFVKAFIEEVIFRDILPLKVGIGDVASSILFGVFHFAMLWSLGATLPVMIAGMITLSLLGYIWSQVRQRLTLMGAVGSHFGYNMVVLGVFGI